MGSLRRFIGRHAGLVLAMLACSVLAGLLLERTPRLKMALPEHEAHVAEFSPDGRVLVTDGASGGCIRDAATGRVLVRLMRAGAGGSTPATDITWPRFTAGGRRLIAQLGEPRFGSEQTVTLAVFDAATGRERASFAGVGAGIWHGSAEYALSADGSTLAFCRTTGFAWERKGRVTVWEVDAEKVVVEFPGLPPLALSPDGRTLAHGENDDARSRTAFPVIRKLELERPARARARRVGASTGLGAGPVAFSPDGKLLTASMPTERSAIAEVRDVDSGQVRAALKRDYSRPDHFGDVQVIRFSPDSRTLFLEHLGRNPIRELIQCWDLSGASPRLVVQGPSESFAPEASRASIAVYDPAMLRSPWGSGNGALEVYDLPAAEARLRLARDGVLKATISPDGRILAVSSNRSNQPDPRSLDAFLRDILRTIGLRWEGPPMVNEIKLRDASTGQLIGTITRKGMGFPGPLTFSPDGKTLVVKELPWDSAQASSANPMTDWHVELWDVPAGWRIGWLSSLFIVLATAALVLVGAWTDRRRARTGRPAEGVESAGTSAAARDQ